MTRMPGSDCGVMCNFIITQTHTHSSIPPSEDQCEWHRMTRMAGPDCTVMCNLIKYTHTYTRECIPFVASDQMFCVMYGHIYIKSGD